MSLSNQLSKTKFPHGERTVYVQHISFQTPLASLIKKIEGNYVTIKASKVISNLILGDPVTIKYLDAGIEFVLSGDVTDEIDAYTFRMILQNVEEYANNREHSRLAVSLNAVVIGLDNLDYICSTVKSLSPSGLAINCKYVFEIDSQVIVNIISSSSDTINFIGRIIRKNDIFDYYEYGIKIIQINDLNKNKLDTFLNELNEAEQFFLKNTLKE